MKKTTEKIILCGEIENTTSLMIGSGDNDHADIDILMDHEETPFIPASSFLGVLRHACKPTSKDKESFKTFWGYSLEKESFQSNIRCSDLFPSGNGNPVKIRIRDGVKINNATGRAEDNGKYNFQTLEPGTCFSLRLEINVKEGQKDLYRKIALSLKTYLESGALAVGAKTRNGFGCLKAHDIKIMIYDFSTKTSTIFDWLANKAIEDASSMLERDYPDVPDLFKACINFTLNARFKLKTSLLIDSGFSDTFNAAHIMSNGKPLLPGTSIKGSVRARAEKIVNTLSKNTKNETPELIKNLFGYVDSSDSDNNASMRSKIIAKEKYLAGFKPFEQYRIRMDRFTGGAINGALFGALPIGSPDTGKDSMENHLELTLEIEDCKNYEAGLILLVLKDLWTGDCTLGGGKAIGRGVLQGVKADITYKNDHFTIEDRFDNFIFSKHNKTLKNKDDIQNFIKTLCQAVIKKPATIGEEK